MSIIMHQGDTSPDAVWQIYDDTFNPISVPSGSTFQLYIFNKTTNTVRIGAGSWTINSYSPVNATYHWASQDTAISGFFTIYARITTPTGQISSTDEIPWSVLPGLILGGLVLATQDVNILQVNGATVSSSNPLPTSINSIPAGTNLIGTMELADSGGTNKLAIDASGNASMKLGAALPAGTNVIGHVVVDSAGNVTITSLPALPAGTNVIGHVIIDSASNVVVTGLPALPTGSNTIGNVGLVAGSALVGTVELADSAGTNKLAIDASGNASTKLGAALPAGTNVIGHVIIDSAGNVVVTGLPALPTGSNTIGNVGLVAGSAVIGGIELVDSAGTNKASISAGGAVKVDNSGVTQTVTGTVTSNQGTANATPWNENIAQVGGAAISQGSKTSANSLPVVIASDQVPIPIQHGNVIDSSNSSTATLTANSVFTGTGVSSLNYSAITIEVFADQASAAGGLSIQQSQDNSHWDTVDTFSISASTAFNTIVNLIGQYYRIVYTNGGTGQSTFRLQTVKMVADAVLPRTLTAAGALRTDASATTQPISGNVGLNTGSNLVGSINVVDSAGTNKLAVDASGRLTLIPTQTVTLNAGSNLAGGVYVYDSAGSNKLAIDSSGRLTLIPNSSINVAQWAGAAPSLTNPVIVDDRVRQWTVNGQVYSAAINRAAGATGNFGLSVFSTSTNTKNIMFLSCEALNNGGATIFDLQYLTTDPALASTMTAVNMKAGGAASSLTSTTGNITFNTATVTIPGTLLTSFDVSNSFGRTISSGCFPYVIPAGTAGGLALFSNNTNGTYGITLTWVEF